MLYQKLLHGHKQLQSYCVKKSLFINFSGLNEYMIAEILYHQVYQNGVECINATRNLILIWEFNQGYGLSLGIMN